MSVATATRKESTAVRYSPQWLAERLSGVALHVAIIGLTVAWMVPTIGLLVSSFRPFSAIATTGWWTALSPPFQFSLDNYSNVLQQSNLGTSFFNSFMVSIPATIIPITIAAFAAYAFAWMKFPGRDWIFLSLVGFLAVPLQLTFIPVTKVFVAWGITLFILSSIPANRMEPLPFPQADKVAHGGIFTVGAILLASAFFRTFGRSPLKTSLLVFAAMVLIGEA